MANKLPLQQTKRLFLIVRDGIELGVLPEAEVRELLSAGFLRLTDVCRRETSPDWKSIAGQSTNPIKSEML